MGSDTGRWDMVSRSSQRPAIHFFRSLSCLSLRKREPRLMSVIVMTLFPLVVIGIVVAVLTALAFDQNAK